MGVIGFWGTGIAHERQGQGCQDALGLGNLDGGGLVLALSDGASGSRYGAEAADANVQAVVSYFEEGSLTDFEALSPADRREQILNACRRRLAGLQQDRPEAPPEDFYRYTRLLQENLEEMLSSLNGVGKCRVLITFSDSGETVYACDEDSLSTEEKTDLSRKYVLISSRSEGLVLKVYSPSVLGVAVICRGGDSTRVKNDVTEVLSRTLGIPADRISVKKMSS